MIAITQGRGFHLTFDNGWTISVQIGHGNYCANQDKGPYDNAKPEPSPDAEIAVWGADGNMVELVHDVVHGWVPTEDIGNAIAFVQAGQIDELCKMLGATSKQTMNLIVEDILLDDKS